MWRIYLVEWNDENSAKILETKSDIDSFQVRRINYQLVLQDPLNSDHIVNCPFIDPFNNN